jgi:hypothetical protein
MDIFNIILSALSIITAFICMVGALHYSFDDNISQRLGMGGIAIACISMAYNHSFTPHTALLTIGVSAYAIGTFCKLARLL